MLCKRIDDGFEMIANNTGERPETRSERRQAMTKVETETGKMVAALRDGLHGLHLSRMALVAESRALRLAGRRAEREKVWARVEEITAQIEVSTKELAEHMLRWENETQRRGDAEAAPEDVPY